MAFKRAAVLALAAQLCRAAPGSLRGLAADEAAQAVDATEPQAGEVPQAGETELVALPVLGDVSDDFIRAFAQNSTHVLLGGAVAAAGLEEAEEVEPEEPLLDLELEASAAWGGAKKYWDGQCTPCPPYYYHHCWAGGRLVSARSCGAGQCEGQCLYYPRQGQPTQVLHPGTMKLYHMTSPWAAEQILKSGFRPGNTGYCGGAIYFYGNPHVPDSKLGPNSHKGAVIEAVVNLGSMAVMDRVCDGAEDAKHRYDSLRFNPGDGNEYVIASNSRVVSMRRYS